MDQYETVNCLSLYLLLPFFTYKHTHVYTHRRWDTADWIVLLAAEDDRAGRHLLLRGASWEMLSRTEWRREAMRWHRRNSI